MPFCCLPLGGTVVYIIFISKLNKCLWLHTLCLCVNYFKQIELHLNVNEEETSARGYMWPIICLSASGVINKYVKQLSNWPASHESIVFIYLYNCVYLIFYHSGWMRCAPRPCPSPRLVACALPLHSDKMAVSAGSGKWISQYEHLNLLPCVALAGPHTDHYLERLWLKHPDRVWSSPRSTPLHNLVVNISDCD